MSIEESRRYPLALSAKKMPRTSDNFLLSKAIYDKAKLEIASIAITLLSSLVSSGAVAEE